MEEDFKSAVNKRNFFLSLSVPSGQQLAHSVGFSVPSEEVQKNEIVDTLTNWLILSGVGITSEMLTCIDWMLEATKNESEVNEEEERNARAVMSSFAGAFLMHLLENGFIELNFELSMKSFSLNDLKKMLGDTDV